MKLEDLKLKKNESYIDFESEEETEFIAQQDQSVFDKWDVKDL